MILYYNCFGILAYCTLVAVAMEGNREFVSFNNMRLDVDRSVHGPAQYQQITTPTVIMCMRNCPPGYCYSINYSWKTYDCEINFFHPSNHTLVNATGWVHLKEFECSDTSGACTRCYKHQCLECQNGYHLRNNICDQCGLQAPPAVNMTEYPVSGDMLQTVSESQISASSYSDRDRVPAHVPLHSGSYWRCSDNVPSNCWIQVQLNKATFVWGIATAKPDPAYGIKLYNLQFATLDNSPLETYNNIAGNDSQSFVGSDPSTLSTVFNWLHTPTVMTSVKIQATQCEPGYCALNMNIIGVDHEDLLVSGPNHGVTNERITAKSVKDNVTARYGPHRARINNVETEYNPGNVMYAGAWLAGDLSSAQWIQVDLNGVLNISGVVVQGRANYTYYNGHNDCQEYCYTSCCGDQYITQFYVLHGNTQLTESLVPVQENGITKTFNPDFSALDNSWYYGMFPCNINADRVRLVIPVGAYVGHVALRFDLLGDFVDECLSSPCQNNQQCVNYYHQYICLD